MNDTLFIHKENWCT